MAYNNAPPTNTFQSGSPARVLHQANRAPSTRHHPRDHEGRNADRRNRRSARTFQEPPSTSGVLGAALAYSPAPLWPDTTTTFRSGCSTALTSFAACLSPSGVAGELLNAPTIGAGRT